MKKIIVVLLLLAIAGLGATYSFLSKPEVKDASFIASVSDEYQATWKANQEIAKDAEKNGYLQADLLPYWGRPGVEAEKDSAIGTDISDWANKYSSLGASKAVDHKALQESGDEAYKKSFEAFQKRQRSIFDAFNRPRFLALEDEISLLAPTPDYQAIQTCCVGLSGFVEYKMAQGDTNNVLSSITAILNLADNLADDQRLLPGLVSVQCRQKAIDTVDVALNPDSVLSDQQWARLTKLLWQSLPAESNGAVAMRGELAGIVTSLVLHPETVDSAITAEGKNGEFYYLLPGAGARELRIFQNDVIPMFKALDKGEIPTLPEGSGTIASLVIPTFHSADKVISTQRKRFLITSLATSITAFHKSTDTYPADVQALAEIGLSPPKDVDFEALGISYQATEPVQVSVKLEPEEVEAINESHKNYPQKHWGQVKDGELVLAL